MTIRRWYLQIWCSGSIQRWCSTIERLWSISSFFSKEKMQIKASFRAWICSLEITCNWSREICRDRNVVNNRMSLLRSITGIATLPHSRTSPDPWLFSSVFSKILIYFGWRWQRQEISARDFQMFRSSSELQQHHGHGQDSNRITRGFERITVESERSSSKTSSNES